MALSLHCQGCGEPLAKYELDRFADRFCSAGCAQFWGGMVVGAALIAWAEAIRKAEPTDNGSVG